MNRPQSSRSWQSVMGLDYRLTPGDPGGVEVHAVRVRIETVAVCLRIVDHDHFSESAHWDGRGLASPACGPQQYRALAGEVGGALEKERDRLKRGGVKPVTKVAASGGNPANNSRTSVMRSGTGLNNCRRPSYGSRSRDRQPTRSKRAASSGARPIPGLTRAPPPPERACQPPTPGNREGIRGGVDLLGVGTAEVGDGLCSTLVPPSGILVLVVSGASVVSVGVSDVGTVELGDAGGTVEFRGPDGATTLPMVVPLPLPPTVSPLAPSKPVMSIMASTKEPTAPRTTAPQPTMANSRDR